ncbi:MAG: hypothetical protein ACTSWY_11530, partial [Promethearchaeota archaeon]
MISPNSFYIETYGCSFNQSDSSKIKKILISNNFSLLPEEHIGKDHEELLPEFIIINTCAVKSQTQAKNLFRINNIKLNPGQKLIIAGCLPWISEELLKKVKNSDNIDKIIAIIDVNSYDKIAEIIEKYRKYTKNGKSEKTKNTRKTIVYKTNDKMNKGK